MFVQRLKTLHLFRKKPVWLTLGVFLVLFFFCIIKLLQPKSVFQFQGNYDFEEGCATEETVIYENISLKPGVYYVELEYQAERDFLAHCYIKDGTVFEGGLLTNGDQVYGGLDRTGFTVWLYESTESMQVVVSYSGAGSFSTGNLTITDTGKLWTMLLVILFFGTAAVSGILIYHYYNREYPVAMEKKQIVFFLVLINLIAALPYLYNGPVSGGDTIYHAHRIEGIKDGLLSGQFPVRLEPRWIFGHGYAAAIYYCNVLLYLPGLLRLAGFPVAFSYNCYYISINIMTSLIAWHCFRRMFKSEAIGLMCSAMHTLSLFRLDKTAIVGAMGEGSAMTFLPLVLYGWYRVFGKDTDDPHYKTAWLPLAFGYAGLIQTHVLSCELTAFLTVLICLVYIRKVFRLKTFLELAKGALGALGLSLWFLVPFLDYYLTQDAHVKHVSARTIQLYGMQPQHLFFQFWQEGSNEHLQYAHATVPGFMVVFVLAVFAALWFGGFLKRRRDGLTFFVKVIACFGGLFLVMSLNFFPWDRIHALNPLIESLVSSLQMPNRFYGWAGVCMVAVFGYCLSFFRGKSALAYRTAAVVVIAGIVVAYFYYWDAKAVTGAFLRLYNEEGMGVGYISGAEYLAEGTDSEVLTYGKAVAGEGVSIDSYEKEYVHVRMNCTNATAADSYVELPMLAYKGYRARSSDGASLAICHGDNHVVRVILSAGFSGQVDVRFVSPIYWRISEVVSLIVLVAVVVWTIYGRRRLIWQKSNRTVESLY